MFTRVRAHSSSLFLFLPLQRETPHPQEPSSMEERLELKKKEAAAREKERKVTAVGTHVDCSVK